MVPGHWQSGHSGKSRPLYSTPQLPKPGKHICSRRCVWRRAVSADVVVISVPTVRQWLSRVDDTGTQGSPPGNLESSGSAMRSPGDELSVRGPDERGALIQLTARWAEIYGPAEDDDGGGALERFRAAYGYLDAVIHGIEPPRRSQT
jgi:hypothetical protein